MPKSPVISVIEPCPFCGSEARFLLLYSYAFPGEWQTRIPALDGSEQCGKVKCQNRHCGASSDVDIEVNAVALWNHRPGQRNPKLHKSLLRTARLKGPTAA